MLNQLHKEIDRLEELRERAAEIAQRTRERILDAVRIVAEDGSVDALPDALELLASAVEDDLAPLTTEAFELGVTFSGERGGKV